MLGTGWTDQVLVLREPVSARLKVAHDYNKLTENMSGFSKILALNNTGAAEKPLSQTSSWTLLLWTYKWCTVVFFV